MRYTTKSLALGSLISLLAAFPAIAQQAPCQSETIQQLWSSKTAQHTVADSLKKQDEGANPGDLENEASKKSFLPFLRFALDQLGVLSQDKNSFSVSQRIDLGSSPLELNVQGKVQEPQIYEALKEKLPEKDRQSRIDALLSDLNESDDFTLSLSANLRNRNFGRDLDTYGDLFTTLWRKQKGSVEATVDLPRVITEITADPKIPDIDENTDLCSIQDEATRSRLREAVVSAAREEAAAAEDFKQRLKTTRLSEFYKLVDNQPQIHLTAAYRWRDKLLGPSGLSAKLSYEHGFANVNRLRKQYGDQLTLENYSDYISDPTTQSFLEHDDRLSGSIEYQDDRNDRIVLPDDGINLEIGKGRTLKGTLTYGRSLLVDANRQVLSRIDLSASYENVSDDPLRQDRGVASVTYSARVRNPWFFTVDLNYANHAKFLPKSDRDFGAHVGISYRLFSKESDN